MFHHERDSIEAHLTIVFAALAATRHLTDTTGYSISTLRPVRDVMIRIRGQDVMAETPLDADAADIISKLQASTGH
ncbi:hypothetical protein [Gordonia sp. VNK21]|uniref:hypothetical protein n=1 Tax=Gordonia sp. VNK21 TaxID=3382483 RepID=UPI0038D41F55